ncbi:unnamed protein product [Euphydryas editha]|uniref:PiggyBac transposable element-derived protein domain-containing protein n=1 Tax=Euphydryas editha TaxID=104508 RepID=A0AAU9V486_EUPED|nr:unnamed protein product [Euphydryas editha]
MRHTAPELVTISRVSLQSTCRVKKYLDVTNQEDLVPITNLLQNDINEDYFDMEDIDEESDIDEEDNIDLLYLSGVYKSNRLCLKELWGQDGDGIEKFGLVMSIKHFIIPLRCLRFDDMTPRSKRKRVDRLAPIRNFFETFVENCQSSYSHGENVSVDEMLPGFRSKCSFRHIRISSEYKSL